VVVLTVLSPLSLPSRLSTTAVNVVGTVSRPMLTKSMLSELLRAYKADKHTRKDFENPEDDRFQKSVDGLSYAVDNGKWKLLCHRANYKKP
jgi:hypothetical protein